MGIFKANDIRGIFPEELSPEVCYRIGFYLPEILGCGRILIGRDARLSSVNVFEMLTRGINDAGADVIDIGMCDTPAVYFATVKFGFSGSVMITASHNPPSYNGLKISMHNAVPVGLETGLERLGKLITGTSASVKNKGKIGKLEIEDSYVDHITSFAGNLNGLKVVFDASNGAAGVYLDSIFSRTALRYSSINTVPDGNFPNHGPNPLERTSWKDIRQAILKNNADVGVVFDGDGDRAVFFDEKGEFISPDIITSLIGKYYFIGKTTDSDRMFYDIRSSKSVAEYISKLGGIPSPCSTGHANIKKLLRDTEGIYAGELSGHYYFKDNYYCDSGFIAAVIVFTVLNEQKIAFSEIVREINPYAFSGEINFNIKDIQAVLTNLEEKYSHGRVTKMDGLRVDFDSWWFILRPSGAESVLRLVVEAENREVMDEKVDELTHLILTEN